MNFNLMFKFTSCGFVRNNRKVSSFCQIINEVVQQSIVASLGPWLNSMKRNLISNKKPFILTMHIHYHFEQKQMYKCASKIHAHGNLFDIVTLAF